MDSDHQIERILIRRVMMRVVFYCALVAGVFLILYLDTQRQWNIEKTIIGELSYTELAQELLLIGIAALFWDIGGRQRPRRSCAVLMTGLALLALCRELDFLLDQIHHGAWRIPALVVMAGFGAMAWQARENFIPDFAAFICRREFGIMLCGFLIVVVFSRLSGWRGFWETTMGDAYMRGVKNIVEEGLELLGYVFIAIAAAEYYVFKKQIR